ncbi:MAG TPA: hypothetical protein VKZ95_04520 [Sphingobacteriaceae bacterium]|nr:hypothetical protein [Sphingobacteriaceae bacterium]
MRLKSKLEELFDNDLTFGTDSLNFENGIMINQHNDMVDYIILEYRDRFDVYLNLFDDGEPPYRNILVKGSSSKKDVAKRIAVRKLNNEAYGHLN